MHHLARRLRLLIALGAAGAVVAACSSSSHTASPTGSAGGPTYTIGVLTDLTGAGASANKTTPQGVEAGIALAAKDGIKLKYVAADTQTSPAGALSAAKQLVQQDHVSAIVANSVLAFAAAPYLTSQGVPVVGIAGDGPEWGTSKNMFAASGFLDTSKATTNLGRLIKMEGGTDFGAVGYGISPTSAESAKASAFSVEAANLQVEYLNAQLPFGTTNVAPVGLAMKAKGVNAVYSATDPNTSFALVQSLRQYGDDPKIAVLPTGYGGDLLQAGAGTLQNAQGIYFSVQFEPVELQTAATKEFQGYLAGVGVTGVPTYSEYAGYASVALLEAALKATGANPSASSLITALDNVKNFNAAGLLGSHGFDLDNRAGTAGGPDGCDWYVKLSGSNFVPVSGASPLCGSVIPGKSASASG